MDWDAIKIGAQPLIEILPLGVGVCVVWLVGLLFYGRWIDRRNYQLNLKLGRVLLQDPVVNSKSAICSGRFEFQGKAHEVFFHWSSLLGDSFNRRTLCGIFLSPEQAERVAQAFKSGPGPFGMTLVRASSAGEPLKFLVSHQGTLLSRLSAKGSLFLLRHGGKPTFQELAGRDLLLVEDNLSWEVAETYLRDLWQRMLSFVAKV